MENGFKANLPELLAAMRLYNANSWLLRKRPDTKTQKFSQITSADLKELYNVKSGLKAAPDNWSVRFITESLAYAVRPNNGRFPGSAIHSLKSRQGVTTSEGLFAKMGWTPKAPDTHKVLQVLYNIATEDDMEKLRQATLPKDAKFTYTEHRAVIAALLPRLSAKSDLAMLKQIKVDPLDIKSDVAIKAYSKVEYVRFVDAINLAYAIKIALSRKGSKATVEQYYAARQHVLRSSASVRLVDGDGDSHSAENSIHVKTRGFLQSQFPYNEGVASKKRAKSPEPAAPINADGSVSMEVEPPAKKVALPSDVDMNEVDDKGEGSSTSPQALTAGTKARSVKDDLAATRRRLQDPRIKVIIRNADVNKDVRRYGIVAPKTTMSRPSRKGAPSSGGKGRDRS
jgi:hypothetical protein